MGFDAVVITQNRLYALYSLTEIVILFSLCLVNLFDPLQCSSHWVCTHAAVALPARTNNLKFPVALISMKTFNGILS